MRVYRLETEQGTGVFESGAAYPYSDQSGWRCTDPPNPYYDQGLGHIYSTEYCGFESIEQLLIWFGAIDSYHILEEYGIFVRIYELDDQHVRRGQYQVVFFRHLAKIVEEAKPTDFVKNALSL